VHFFLDCSYRSFLMNRHEAPLSPSSNAIVGGADGYAVTCRKRPQTYSLRQIGGLPALIGVNMMLQVIVIPLALLVITGGAYAQVYKCRDDGTGKVTFSDVPCHGKSSGHAVEVKPANQFDGSGLRARADQERWVEAAQRAAPSGGAIGSPSVSRFDSRAAACEEAKKPIPGARGQTANQRNAIMAACYGVSVPPPEREDPLPNPRVPLSAPSPSVIVNCDSAGCWDNVGGRYNRGAGNTYFPASGGGACQMIGGTMQCP
jgi:hypothetical protein